MEVKVPWYGGLFQDSISEWVNKVGKYQQYKGYSRNHKSRIEDHGKTSILHIDGALSIEREECYMQSQHLPLGFYSHEKWTYIWNLKLDDINLSIMTLVIGVDVSETFVQGDINKGGDGQSLLIKVPFGWEIVGNNRNTELDVQAK